MRSRTHTSGAAREPWRGILRRHLTLLLAIKLAALALLWVLCFSPAHRSAVDGQAAARHLGLAPSQQGTHD